MLEYSKEDVLHDIKTELKFAFLQPNTHYVRDTILRNIAVTIFDHHVFDMWHPDWRSSGHELARQLGLRLECNPNSISLSLGRLSDETIVLSNI